MIEIAKSQFLKTEKTKYLKMVKDCTSLFLYLRILKKKNKLKLI